MMKKIGLCCFAVCLAAACFAGCNAGSNTYTFDNAKSYSVGEGSVAAESITELDIDWVAGGVTVQGEEDMTEISFSETLEKGTEGAGEEYKLRYLVDGSVLRIRFLQSGTKIAKTEKTLNISVPATKQFAKIQVNNVSGGIYASDFKTEAWEAKTVSGKTTVVHTDPAELRVESTSGDIVVGQGTYGAVNLKTVSGKISFENSFDSADLPIRSFRAETTSGDVRYWANAAPTDGAQIVTVSGDVKFLFAKDASFSLSYDTVSGTVYDAFGTTQKDGAFVAGSGSPDVLVTTVSGGLELQQLAE